jgi:RNA polymerase sigma-70 factor, ECF subfamily
MDGGVTTPTTVWTPERLHARFAPKVARHVRAVLGPDADREDLVQNVLITVFLGIDRLRDPACLDKWVAQITRTELRTLFRRRRVRRADSLETLPEQLDPSFQVNVDARDLAARALRVMSVMPPKDRALLTSYWFGHNTINSMAARAGCSVITVRRRLFRAKNRFAKLARRDPALASCIEDSRAWATWASNHESS